MCGGRLSGGREGLAERFADCRLDFGARRDDEPHRPLDFIFAGCPAIGATVDTGILYAPNIIDAYTRSDGAGGLDVFWNVSAWNPYLVALLRTNVRPPAPERLPCARGKGPRLRWCAKD